MGETPIGWNPSKEQFDRYLQREVELARANLKRGAHAGSMLCTAETIARAQQKP